LNSKLLRFALCAFSTCVAAFVACTGAPTDLDAFPNPTEECTADTECPGGAPICDELAGCVACQFSEQCDEGERCHQRECVPAPSCNNSTDCPEAQPACDIVQGYCVECSVNADCGADARCLAQTCEPATACVNSRDCADDEVCDLASGFCVECAADLDCPAEHACVDNACQPKCASDKECVDDGLLCDRTLAHCVECLRDVDCPDAYFCAAGKCAADVCATGSALCSTSKTEIHGCNENGSAYVAAPCPPGSTCAEGDAGPACEDWICTPSATGCETPTRLQVCSSDGLTLSTIDCAEADGACEYGACVDVVCTPAEYSCVNGTSMLCNTAGTRLDPIATCAISTFCSATSGTCEVDVCVAGQPACDGNVATVCKTDGSGYEEGTDCEDDEEICWAGQCLPEVCSEGTHCFEGDAFQCTNGGTSRTVTDVCSSTEYCSSADEPAQCLPTSCTAGEETCLGDVAGTCNSAGTGLESGSVDCSVSDQACFDGECKDIVCIGNQTCSDGDVHNCNDNGTTIGTLDDNCSESEFCHEYDSPSGSGETTECWTDECSQGETICINGGGDSGIGLCNAEGSGFDVVTPCDDDEYCVGSTCLPVICSSSNYYCLNGNSYLCGSDGTTNQLADTCAVSEHCKAGFSSCQADVCTAGAPLCNGANVTVCAADGSGPADAGTACPVDQICQAGTCTPVVCAANAYRCNGNVERCNSFGTAWATWTTCSTAQYCNDAALPSEPVCSADFCAADQPTCAGELLATCGPDGGSYTAPGTDCSLTSQLCNETACVDFEELTYAGAAAAGTTTPSSRTYFNRFYMVNERKLTKIEQYFATGGTSQFTFYIYRSTSPTSGFSLVTSKLVADDPVAPGRFVSSGTIDVTLEAGYYYLIGVHTSGSHQPFSQTVADSFESYGRFDGGVVYSGSGASSSMGDTTTVYRQRITLEPSP
jgi:hypothetical protein